MAPTLTSNSFLLTAPPRSKLPLKNPKPTTLVLASAAKKNNSPFSSPFRIGKQNDGSSEKETNPPEPAKNGQFFIDFGKFREVRSLIPVSQPAPLSFGNQRRKDPRTVFVAGATGQSGLRIAQRLLRQGFSVRAGVPDLTVAQDLARLAAQYKIISSEESRRLNAVQSTFGDADSTAKAIGNAGKVVVTVGPAENGPTSEVTTNNALQVVQAAQLAGVKHVVVVYESFPFVSSSTYNVLDGLSSFFSNLFSRNQQLTLPEFLAKVVETDVSYTLLKANLTDDFSPENSYGLVISPEGRVGDYYSKVSKSQIASLVADVFSNTAVTENKVVEVGTSSSALSKTVDELFSAIPTDGRRQAFAEAQAKAKAEEEALRASEEAKQATKVAKKLEKEVKKLSEQQERAASLTEEAREKAKAIGASVDGLLGKAKSFSGDFSWAKLSTQIVTKFDEIPKTQIATIRSEAKARSLPPKKAVVKQTQPKPKPKPKQVEREVEVKKVFGGLFKQETIYVDDD